MFGGQNVRGQNVRTSISPLINDLAKKNKKMVFYKTMQRVKGVEKAFEEDSKLEHLSLLGHD